MKRLLFIVALASCLLALTARGDDEGQDITVEPVVLPDGFMGVSKAQGAFWPALDGAWMLNLNPHVGSVDAPVFTISGAAFQPVLNALAVDSNGKVGSVEVGAVSITAAVFSPVLSIGSLHLNSSVAPLDITRWMQVRDVTEEMGELYGGNWLGSAIWHLKLRIQNEGYSDGVMADYWAVKARLQQ